LEVAEFATVSEGHDTAEQSSALLHADVPGRVPLHVATNEVPCDEEYPFAHVTMRVAVVLPATKVVSLFATVSDGQATAVHDGVKVHADVPGAVPAHVVEYEEPEVEL